MTVLTAFGVLGEPSRLAILDHLVDGERPVGELVDLLQVSQPAVSKHLRILRQAGLVTLVPTANAGCIESAPSPWRSSMSGFGHIDDSGRSVWTDSKNISTDGGPHECSKAGHW